MRKLLILAMAFTAVGHLASAQECGPEADCEYIEDHSTPWGLLTSGPDVQATAGSVHDPDATLTVGCAQGALYMSLKDPSVVGGKGGATFRVSAISGTVIGIGGVNLMDTRGFATTHVDDPTQQRVAQAARAMVATPKGDVFTVAMDVEGLPYGTNIMLNGTGTSATVGAVLRACGQ